MKNKSTFRSACFNLCFLIGLIVVLAGVFLALFATSAPGRTRSGEANSSPASDLALVCSQTCWPSRVVVHNRPDGFGKILFLREMISAVLPLSMRTPAPLSVTTEPSSGRQMEETAGQFRPAAQRKICGQFPLQMPITERPLVKVGPFSEPQTEESTGTARQAEQLFSCAAFLSQTSIMERL